jgi:hypothetical protein
VQAFSLIHFLETSMAKPEGKYWLRGGISVVLLAGSTLAHALIVDVDPDWQETEVPAPPALSRDRLLALEMPPYVSLQFGIDAASLAITPDGIVRYVVVARSSSGAVTAFYEGIRCATAEVKTYARSNNEGVWSRPGAVEWQALSANRPSKHAVIFARQAACDGATAASSVADIIRALKK